LKHRQKKTIGANIQDNIWEINVPALILIEVSENSDLKAFKSKFAKLLRDLAVIRLCNVQKIETNCGSLADWTDQDIKTALTNAQLVIISDGQSSSIATRNFWKMSAFAYSHVGCLGFQSTLSIQEFCCLYFGSNLAQDPNLPSEVVLQDLD